MPAQGKRILTRYLRLFPSCVGRAQEPLPRCFLVAIQLRRAPQRGLGQEKETRTASSAPIFYIQLLPPSKCPSGVPRLLLFSSSRAKGVVLWIFSPCPPGPTRRTRTERYAGKLLRHLKMTLRLELYLCGAVWALVVASFDGMRSVLRLLYALRSAEKTLFKKWTDASK